MRAKAAEEPREKAPEKELGSFLSSVLSGRGISFGGAVETGLEADGLAGGDAALAGGVAGAEGSVMVGREAEATVEELGVEAGVSGFFGASAAEGEEAVFAGGV